MEAVPKEGTCVRTTPIANSTQHSTFCPSVSLATCPHLEAWKEWAEVMVGGRWIGPASSDSLLRPRKEMRTRWRQLLPHKGQSRSSLPKSMVRDLTWIA